jgi:hypothetical protein
MRTMSVQLDSRTLATLQFVAAAIRRESGVAIGMSAIVRALVQWLAEAEIDLHSIRTSSDLKKLLLVLVSAPATRDRDRDGP